MALADRFYMRDEYQLPRATYALIAALIVAFVVQRVLHFYQGYDASVAFGLTLGGITRGEIWRLITFQFLHSGLLHLIFNGLGLFFLGRAVEETLGTRRFLGLYFLAGVCGGLMFVASALLPKHIDPMFPDGPIAVGASAGVCGVLAFFCAMNPARELTTFIYFFPVNIRARYLLWFTFGLAAFGTIVPFGGVAHGAHLGGILLGLGFHRWIYDSDRVAGWWARVRPPRPSRPVVRVRFPKAAGAESARPRKPRKEDTDFISREVDPILEKISAQGIHSLTPEEKRILEAARHKMAKR